MTDEKRRGAKARLTDEQRREHRDRRNARRMIGGRLLSLRLDTETLNRLDALTTAGTFGKTKTAVITALIDSARAIAPATRNEN